jgi:hypothetical protein
MALKVIGAGLGRTGTLSLKLALEHIGFGRCYHMSEMLAHIRSALPLWIAAGHGHADWDAIFDGYQSSTDYPGCAFWRELAAHYPDAKIILTTRNPESWFESVSATIFSKEHRARFENNPAMAEFFALTVFKDIEDKLHDREAMLAFFRSWNQAVMDEVPAERLLVYAPGDGWEPLCRFLGVPVPDSPYPRVNSREEMTERTGGLDEHAGPPPPEVLEGMVRGYLDELRAKAFPATV